MLATTVGAGEERVLAIEGDGPDGTLDGVGVDLDAAVIEEARQAEPTAQGVADRTGDRRFLRDSGELNFQPSLEAVEDRLCLVLTQGATGISVATADVGLA